MPSNLRTSGQSTQHQMMHVLKGYEANANSTFGYPDRVFRGLC